MSSEYSYTIPIQNIPEPHSPVCRARGNIVRVWMKSGTRHISKMASKYPQRLVVICCPQTENKSFINEKNPNEVQYLLYKDG